jgi:hypothetical protein
MITGSIGVIFIWLNTLMLVANATVTTINSVTIMREVRNRDKKSE